MLEITWIQCEANLSPWECLSPHFLSLEKQKENFTFVNHYFLVFITQNKT